MSECSSSSYSVEARYGFDVEPYTNSSMRNWDEEEGDEEAEDDEEDSDISDSELNDYKEAVHRLLKFRTFKIRGPNDELECPFCDVNKKLDYTRLLQHAVRVSDDLSERAKQRANHLAMAKYLAVDLATEVERLPRPAKKILHNLNNEIDLGKKNLDLLQDKYDANTLSIRTTLEDNDKTHNLFFEEVRALLCTASDELKGMLGLQEMMNFVFKNEKRQLDDYWRGELKKVEATLLEEKAKMDDILREKNDLELLNQHLLAKERLSNDELQGARKESIKHLSDTLSGSRVKIGIKRIGEIDVKAFKNTCKKRFAADEVDMKAVELCSEWQEKLKDPQWHPFQVVEDDEGNPQRLLKEDDKVLKGLKDEWGEEIYDAVVAALKDLNDYNPSGCYVVPEIWNFKENKKATLEQVISHLFAELKTRKRRRT